MIAAPGHGESARLSGVAATPTSPDSVETGTAGRSQLSPPVRLPRSEVVAVIGVTCLGLVLCLIDLGSRSLWLDEFYSAFLARFPGRSLWHAITSDGGNFMAYYALLRAWVIGFGWGPTVLRLPSALAGAGLVPVVFSLGRRAGGPRVGLVACLLAAVSPPLVVWSQQARGYSMAVFAVSLTWLMAVRLQDCRTLARYGVFCVLAIISTYVQLTASLVVAAALAWLYLASRDGKAKAKVVACMAFYLLCCLPLVLIVQAEGFARRATASVGWVAPPGWASARFLLSELVSGSVPDFFRSRLENAMLSVVFLLCWTAALVMLLLVRRRRGSAGGESVIAEIAAGFVFWLVVPVVLDWIVSVGSGYSIFEPSFLLSVVPAGLLLAAYGLANLRLRLARLAGTAVFVALSLAVLVPTYGASSENWKGAVAFVLVAAHPGDCVAFDAPSGVREFAYYVNEAQEDRASLEPIFPRQTWSQALAASVPYSLRQDYTSSAVSGVRRSCKRIWMVVNRPRADLGFAEAEVAYTLGSTYRKTALHGFAGITVDLIVKR